MKRALGVPVQPGQAPSFAHWLHGIRNGTELIVYTFDVGSGSSATTHTGTLARIDPPLLLGMAMRARGALDGLFGVPRTLIGDPFVDAKLHIDGFDAAQISRLFVMTDGVPAVLLHALKVIDSELQVSDSAVLLSRQGTITDAPSLASRTSSQRADKSYRRRRANKCFATSGVRSLAITDSSSIHRE